VGLVAGLLLVVGEGPIVAALSLVAGAFYGAVVAILPTVLGGFVVVVVLVRRHPHPASSEEVHQDLGVVFASVVLALDLVVLVFWLVLGGWTVQMLLLVAALLLIDAAAGAVLVPARRSISRVWVESSGVAGVAPARPH